MSGKKIFPLLKEYSLKAPAFLYADDESYLKRFTASEWNEYALWLFRNRLFTIHSLKKMHQKVKTMKMKPRISIIMPVYNPDPVELRQAVDSLLWQAYPYWELCLVDDLSDKRDYLKVLGRLRDRRIKVYLRDIHTGIAETSQYALEKATGEYIALMDQDDELYPDALYAFADILQEREVDYFYSDRDMISPEGGRYMHFARPDWSPEYLLSFNYTPHLEIYKKQLLSDIGGFRKDFEGSHDYDLVLRATEQTARIYHHPMILYSWRQSHTSIAQNLEMKSYVYEAGIKALKDTVRRRRLPVKEVVENASLWRGHYRLIWDEKVLSKEKISLFLICSNIAEVNRLRELFQAELEPFPNIRLLEVDYELNNINALLKDIADGYVFFCDDSITKIIASGFIDMLGYLSIDGVSVVGPKFLNGSNKIFNAGISITDSGKLLFAYRGSPENEHGYGAVVSVPRNVSAVFPSFWGCKITDLRKRDYLKGTKRYFYSALNFFREVIETGERIVYVPYMCLEVDAGKLNYEDDENLFAAEWRRGVLRDRYYNTNLTDAFEDFGLRL